ncbi:hypothetical protein FM042_08480 [Aliidiomarina halalkaliphila]|uniref:SOS-response cell division inhibitor n=1 Tax=Aliidiomarina halalkaliphila TaxID=2593535 RepID=A0A552X232_9GAMM|nr:hypothetical protein [Aliidiomarina halalkaliphila]TRW49006.1 hypothetical protein FM042_08480 [Aliidiomarina halalkaliphila]
MNYSALTRRFPHPGVWGHETKPSTSVAVCEQPTLQQHLWVTLSALRKRDDQWVTLIGKPAKAFIEQLIAAGIRPDRIRRVSASDQDTALWATEQALLINNSQIVIAWVGDCHGRDKKRLELAAKASQAQSFFISSESYENPLH